MQYYQARTRKFRTIVHTLGLVWLFYKVLTRLMKFYVDFVICNNCLDCYLWQQWGDNSNLTEKVVWQLRNKSYMSSYTSFEEIVSRSI